MGVRKHPKSKDKSPSRRKEWTDLSEIPKVTELMVVGECEHLEVGCAATRWPE